jgi:two-component system response regulator HydG
VAEIPDCPLDSHEEVVAVMANQDASSAGGDRRQILVVDDEPGVRYIVGRILDENGYHVYEARDGAEALDLVRVAPERLDLVVSDVAMPRLNGVQLLQMLALETTDLPMILMSGYTPPELERLGIAAPCGILPKPLVATTFLDEVRRCLRNRH